MAGNTKGHQYEWQFGEWQHSNDTRKTEKLREFKPTHVIVNNKEKLILYRPDNWIVVF